MLWYPGQTCHFLVTVGAMKTLLQTWNERLICGYGFVIDVGSGVWVRPKETEDDWLCGT